MKKSLFILPLLMVSALAGCNGGSKGPNLAEQALDSFPMLIDFATGKELNIVEDKQTAKDLDMFLGLKSLYWQETEFDLTWTPAPAEKWVVSEYKQDESRTKFRPIYGAEAFDCSLQLDIQTKDGKQKATATWSFEAQVHKALDLTDYTYTTIEDLSKGFVDTGKPTSGKYYVVGYIHAHMEEPDHVYSGVYLGDGQYGTQLYAGQLSKLWSSYGFADGDLVIAAGTVSPYKGLMEIKPDAMEPVLEKDYPNVKKPVVLNGNELSWGTNDKGETSAKYHQCAPVEITVSYVSGKVESESAQGDLVFKTSDNKTINVSCNYHIGKTAMASLMELTANIQVGDTYKLRGVISVYDDAPNIIPINGAASFTKVA